MISYGRQSISDEDIDAVVSTLRSDFLTQGPKVSEFEQSICNYTGAKYCVAVANGTVALHLAVLALDIPKESRGVTSSITFVASANCMKYCDINVDFADIDPRTFNITPESIETVIQKNTKLLIPVHFAGQPCDMKSIKELTDRKNIKIIEDAAHALGSSYVDGDKVGSCRYSDLTTFSFHPVKTITTGEGGAITTNNKELYQKMQLLRSHGITKNKELMVTVPGAWYYEMQSLGFNYRLSDLQAALGVSQLKRLDQFKARRRELVERYNRAFSELSWLEIPYENNMFDSCFHLYVVQFDYDQIGLTRNKIMEKLGKNGIGTQVHYIPVHTQPYYKKIGKNNCPNAISYYKKTLSLPLFPDLSNKMQDMIIENIVALVEKG